MAALLSVETETPIDDTREPSGRPVKSHPAQRWIQGGRTMYTLTLPLHDCVTIMRRPNPNAPDENNRRVDERHALAFSHYLRTKPAWISPSILARDKQGTCTFTAVDGANSGRLVIPEPLLAIDGQHRILGISLLIEDLAYEVNRLTSKLSRMRSDDKIRLAHAKLAALKQEQRRLKTEAIVVQIYVEPSSPATRQMFVDVAKNAKRISKTLQSRFDGARLVNRTLPEVMTHPLLRGRVDLEVDRMAASNPNLLGAKHVADLTSAVMIGPSRLLTPRLEATFSDAAVIESVHDWLNTMIGGFADLALVSSGQVSPLQLRGYSLLGSAGMLRVLAGVYSILIARGVTSAEIEEFYTRLSPHMGAPIRADSLWRSGETTTHFEVGASAPVMRSQNLAQLAKAILAWFDAPPLGL